jgi:hypothetical protein
MENLSINRIYGAPTPLPPSPYGPMPSLANNPGYTNPQQPKKKHYGLIAVVGLLVLAVMIVLIVVLLSSKPKSSTSTSSTNIEFTQAQAVNFPATSLLYQSMSGTNSTLSVVGTTSLTNTQINSSISQPTYQSAAVKYGDFFSNSSAALMVDGFSNNSVPTFALIEASGTTVQVNASLDVTIEHILNTSSSNNVFISGTDTMLALIPATNNSSSQAPSYTYEAINLTTGTITDLLQISPIVAANEYFIPEDINPGDNLVSFFASNVVVNSHAVQGGATIAYDLINNKFNINALPQTVDNSVDLALAQSSAEDYVGVSADGNLLAYQTSSNGFGGTGPYVTHIYTVSSGQGIISTGPSIELGGSTAHASFFFSSDDKYVAINGITYPSTNTSGDADLQVINPATGASIENYDEGASYSNIVNPIGWDGVDSLVYLTNTTSTPNTFNPTTAAVHDINFATSKSVNFPTNLGQPAQLIY